MSYIKKEFYFYSSSGLCKIHAASYLPIDNSKIKAIFQICHGMTEHFERYENFIEKLCNDGYAVYANDHLGHGLSVASKDDLGYFGEKDGWKSFIEDAHELTSIAKKQFPNLPVIFFGHSMGSFIARVYSFKYHEELAGSIFCGTAPPNPAIPVGKVFLNLVKTLSSSKLKSAMVSKAAFGAYNKKFDGPTDYEWLSRDRSTIDAYMGDEYCGFLFTVVGYRDLISVLGECSSKNWFENFSKELPVLFISGTDDPVGNYGKGVKLVYDKLVATGKKNADMKLYEGARHEILNESACVDEIYKDVLAWSQDVLNDLEVTV